MTTEIHDGAPDPCGRSVLGGPSGPGDVYPDAGAGPSWLPGSTRNEKAAVASGGRE